MKMNINTYYISRIIPKKLHQFINWFTVYHFTETVPVRLNPEGHFEMIFQLDNDFQQCPIDQGTWRFRPRFFVGGLHNKSYFIKPQHRGSKLISVNFKPHAARYFIPDKLNLFKNKLVKLDDVFTSSDIGRIGEINNKLSIDEIMDQIESFLLTAFKEKPDSRIDQTLSAIVNRNGFINVSNLADIACLSVAQFRKRFNEEVGMSPKEYNKIMRVNHIVERLSSNQPIHLTQLTYEMGYFDQSHFIKDFKSVTGISPKKYLV